MTTADEANVEDQLERMDKLARAEAKVRISQADFAQKSDDWLTGFEAGALAGIDAERERCIKLVEETYVNNFSPASPSLRQAILAAIRT